MTPADLAAAPNLAAYLRLLDDYNDLDDDPDDAAGAALDEAWDTLSSSERETARAISHNPTDLAAAVAHVRAMLAVEPPKENP